MHQKFKRASCLILTLILSAALTLPAFAAETSSDYFAYTDFFATAIGNGQISVEFDINATHTMQEVGATEIKIWEQQSNGRYENVYTFTRYNTSGLIRNNTMFGYAEVIYNGTAGTKYYATGALYAKNADGDETLYAMTRTITA